MDIERELMAIVNNYYDWDTQPPMGFIAWVQASGIGTAIEPATIYIEDWIRIGRDNPWIKYANDPPFNRRSFVLCRSVEELYVFIWHGNWSLGTAFVLGDLCFINQVDGGDEYLTIKRDLPFESASLREMIRIGDFWDFIERIQRATLKQCRELEY